MSRYIAVTLCSAVPAIAFGVICWLLGDIGVGVILGIGIFVFGMHDCLSTLGRPSSNAGETR